MRRHVLCAAAVIAFGLAALPASAASASAPADAGAAAGFQAQARAAGLTAAQAQQLQDRVDARLAQTGGKQVAANKIEYAGGGNLLLNLPGEKYARELGEPIGVQASCSYTYVCVWSGTYYSGEKKSEYACSRLIPIAWHGWGSFINNQTDGTIATVLDRDRRVIGTLGAAYKAQPLYNWTPVYYVDPC